MPYIKSLELDALTIASPDMGGSYRARSFAKFFNAEVVICDKRRKRANEIESMTLIGDVTDQDIVLGTYDGTVRLLNIGTRRSSRPIKVGGLPVAATVTH